MSNRYAIILSCEEYKNRLVYPPTAYCHSDAILIEQTLREYCDYTQENIMLNLLFEGLEEAIPAAILTEIEKVLKKSEEGDTVLFYFAGHGVVENNEAYLILPDTDPKNLNDTALSLKKVSSILSNNNRCNIRIFDACHSGYDTRGVGRSSNSSLFRDIAIKDGWATFSACDGEGVSYPDVKLEQGIFTYYICETIREWDKNEEIIIEELKIRVCNKMEKWCVENKKVQVPMLNASIQGNISIAVRNKKITANEVVIEMKDAGEKEEKVMDGVIESALATQVQTNALWATPNGLNLPKVGSGDSLLSVGTQLRKKEIKDCYEVYQLQKFEMVAETIWNRAIGVLRERVLGFGENFVSEMVGISDLRYIRELPAFEVINIATELGFINKTGRMRLMQSNEIVQHYMSRDIEDEMPQNEVDTVIRASIQYILGYDDAHLRFEYSDFRESLKINLIENTPETLEMLRNSPYFYRKTTVRTLINLMKETQAGEFDIVVSNMLTILVAIWDNLLSDEKYFIGVTYAQYANTGEIKYIKPLKSILLKVHGFDYVPENLRSFTFEEAAKRVIEAHNGMNNFYTEPVAIRKLEKLGSVIPKPALKTVISATLRIKLGNFYGRSWGAQEDANKILKKIQKEDWRYYLEQCLPYDEDVLWKIGADDERTEYWIEIVNTYKLNEIEIVNKNIQKIVTETSKRKTAVVAKQLYTSLK